MIRISDGDLAVEIDPDFGNIAFSFTVHGHEILWKPEGWPKRSLGGIPFLAPWANRIDGDSYFANGKKFLLNPLLENLRFDTHQLPIHGLLLFVDGWKVVAQDAASVTSRLEFWKNPEWMAQFPFAHSIEITHRLQSGSLEVATAFENLSSEPMPLCIGYHPYFQLTDSKRDEWNVRVAASEHVILSDKLIPTGETERLPFANPYPLKGGSLDDVFTGLDGSDFLLWGPKQRIAVRYGPKFPVAVVYAPPTGNFVCMEPMTALTNAFNLDHAGIDAKLQRVQPGETWIESFWITPENFGRE